MYIENPLDIDVMIIELGSFKPGLTKIDNINDEILNKIKETNILKVFAEKNTKLDVTKSIKEGNLKVLS